MLATLVLAIDLQAQTKLPSPAIPGPPPRESIPVGQWEIGALRQESAGKLRKLHSTPEGGGEVPYQAWVESATLLFRADELDWDEVSGDLHASGHVYFHDFREQQEMWCDRLEYNTDAQSGKFYKVHGQTVPRLTTRPGVLTTTSPFFFQGEWAERHGDLYTLHDGFFTNCKMPSPWWRMRAPRFVIEPGQKALSYKTFFLLGGVPLFFAPYFYHSLEAEPRKSGFLLPTIGNSSKGGILLGAGYYWAINRSHDLTYRVQWYTSRGIAHHLDFRGRPREGTEYSALVYGVQDHGQPGTDPVQKYSGISLYAVGSSNLGDGWTARGEANYITSLRFRQEWTNSYNEAVGSEMHSVAFLNKIWDGYYTFNGVFSRLENFQSVEKQIVNPDTGAVQLVPDVVQIRKLPEGEFSGRDRQFWRKLPLWFSFESAAGLLSRSQPVFSSDGTQLIDTFQTGRLMSRVNVAPHLTGALHFGDFHLIPTLGIHETFYSESQAPYEDRFRVVGTDLVRSAREFSLDMIFPSLSRVYARKTFLGEKLKHVMETRATYHYLTGIGTEFDRFIRFDETDLLANSNDLLVSFTNRIYAKRGDNVQEVFTWELKQKRYFDPTFGGALVEGQRNVFDSTADLAAYAFVAGPRGISPIVSSLRISPVGGVGFRWQTDYDPRSNGIVNSTLGIDYRLRKYFASASNSQVHVDPALGTPSADQYRVRLGYGNTNSRGLSAAVDAIYDYRTRTLDYTTTQATYNTDCCGLSVQYYWNGISGLGGFRVALSIANIGSFGTLTRQERLF
ncbi:MAG: LPS assembly protein LptD [Bryobacteraceae bacterium]